jgi:UDP-N-acetylglucosamine transferase subunit ALG13/SAM-dependent methyltransferase
MIFVTVGTHHQGFDRLVQAADELALQSGEEVVIQRGVSSCQPKYARYFDFTSMQEMLEWMDKARVVVAQAGAGTIITAMKRGKPLVLSPRLKQYGENYNDHQVELAAALGRDGRAVLAMELSGPALHKAIEQATRLEQQVGRSAGLVEALRQQMTAWEPEAATIGARLETITRRLDKHQLLLPLVPFWAAAAGLRAAIFWTRGMRKDKYGIKAAYLPRRKGRTFEDSSNRDHYQDEVYQTARRFLTDHGLHGVLDVGCGSGYKLLKYFAEECTLGLELSAGLIFLQHKYPHRDWALSDFDHLPQGEFDLAIAVDVIEHLDDPDALLGFLQRVNCKYVLISTPERSRLGLLARYRPKNRCHLCEWDQAEFVGYVGRYFEILESGVLAHHDQYVIGSKR